METQQKSNAVAGVLILGGVAAVFGVGTFLLLVLLGQDIVLAILATVGVIALLGGFHYMLWGRGASRRHPGADPHGGGFEVTLSQHPSEEDRAVVRQRQDR